MMRNSTAASGPRKGVSMRRLSAEQHSTAPLLLLAHERETAQSPALPRPDLHVPDRQPVVPALEAEPPLGRRRELGHDVLGRRADPRLAQPVLVHLDRDPEGQERPPGAGQPEPAAAVIISGPGHAGTVTRRSVSLQPASWHSAAWSTGTAGRCGSAMTARPIHEVSTSAEGL